MIARFGDGPEDFTDGIGLADRDPVLGEAKRRAIAQGLYDPKKPLNPKMQPVINAFANLIVADITKHQKS